MAHVDKSSNFNTHDYTWYPYPQSGDNTGTLVKNGDAKMIEQEHLTIEFKIKGVSQSHSVKGEAITAESVGWFLALIESQLRELLGEEDEVIEEEE